jgi:hypothetical protein
MYTRQQGRQDDLPATHARLSAGPVLDYIRNRATIPEARAEQVPMSSPPTNPPPEGTQLERVQDLSVDLLTGILHISVAFDWGEAIDLEHARRLVRAEVHRLRRRRRTPTSITFRPAPLRCALGPVLLDLPETGPVEVSAEATIFDFAAVSIAMRLPFRLPAAALTRLAGWLAEPGSLVQEARSALEPLYRKLLPTIQNPLWMDDLSEEYFVFQLPPSEVLPTPAHLLTAHAGWLAGLLHLEAGELSAEESAETLRLHLSYSPEDLFICDWAAAVLLDRDCEETLQTIEFANLQLLEFRHIDNRLDDTLTAAYGMIHGLTKSWLPFWRSHGRSLRVLGELKVEANEIFERTGNVLKLVGEQYLARVYRLLASRFHLDDWEHSIQRKLEVAEGVYQVVSDQAETYRTEFLEMIVIGLIVLEILLALFHH